MAVVAGRAEKLTRHAFVLAERGAHYSARAELIQSFRMVAQALDAESGASDHSRALSAGLVALEEANDFAPRGSRLEADLDMADLVASHHTPVLKQAFGRENPPTPLAALQRYFTFAQEQLATAAGREPAASTALYGLGKLQVELARSAAEAGSLIGPKAMVFYQAALTVDPRNYKAANELGVLLARYGQFNEARRVLIQSMRVSPQPATWHNLAVVHAQLGETDLAARARYEEQLAVESARRRRTSSRRPDDQPSLVDWVDPKTFAQSGAAGAVELPRRSGAVAIRTPAAAPPAASKQQGHAAAGWWPWSQPKR